ncbi:MAG: exonuclease SbcCD subunit D C-terminal domain-containing protein [Aeromonas sp.]
MKLLHTADWHLGHQLHGHDRRYEHAAFLDWLLATLIEREIDALVVAGDLFDTANPSASAWQLLYGFLAKARAACPRLNIVLVGGNHDSPSKLDAPHALLRAFDLHLVGSISRDEQGALEVDRLLVPLTDAAGEVMAWCAAVPFLRSSDLRPSDLTAEQDRLVEGVRQVYAEVLSAGRARCLPDQPLIALGHAYLAAGQLSDLSERRVLGGNQHALPADIFSPADYTALGHLHLAQASAPAVYYSGSPLPLSFSEVNYRHQVLEVSFRGRERVTVTPLFVPRAVELVRLPKTDVAGALAALAALDCPARAHEAQPLLEVRLRLETPAARLRERILAALEGKAVRLARITIEYTGTAQALADSGGQALDDLTPQGVFARCFARQFSGEPPAELLSAFEEVLHEVLSGEALEAAPLAESKESQA